MKASLKRWIGRIPDLSAVLTRFPVPAALMAILTLLFILLKDLPNHNEIGRMMMGLIIGGYVAMMITVAREAQGKSRMIPVQIVIAILLAAIFWFSESLRINLPMAIGATLALLGNVVIWRKPRNDLHVWDFTHKIWTGAAFATLGSIIFTLGVLAIHEALKSLFGININTLMERLLLPIGLALLAPLYWLGTVPPVDESYEELYENPGFVSKAVGFLGTWLLSPLTLIYAVILLAYAAKIILAGSLPKGEIAQLTIPFLLIGTLTWLALEPPFILKNALARLFRKLWFPISVPAVIMLAISVWVRVSEYGLTEERVALILIVIWSLALAIWFTFGPKVKRDIRIIPGLGAILLTLGAVGAQWLSVANQSARLDGYLAELKATETPDLKLRQKTKGAMSYLWGKDAKDAVRDAVKDAGYDVKPNADRNTLFEAVDVKNVDMPSRYDKNVNNLTYHGNDAPVVIAGYDRMDGTFYHSLWVGNDQTFKTIGPATVRIKDGNIIMSDQGLEVVNFALKDWVNALPRESNSFTIEDPQITLLDENGRKAALHIRQITVWKVEDDDKISNGNIEFYLLTSGF